MASRSEPPPVTLVTGASGFTGAYVVAALKQAGHKVHEWVHRADSSASQSVVDITDSAQVAASVREVNPDYVIHLAAIPFVAHGDVAALYEVNIVGTRNLLEALSNLAEPPRRVLLASSANVYGNAGGMLDEATPASPQNDYAVSKLAMEYMSRLWANRIPIAIVRPFNYSGVGQTGHFLLPKIVAHFREGKSRIELGNLDVWRDFNDVRNVADCYLGLLAAAAPGEIYNVCSGREYSLREVVGMMERITGRSMEIVVNPDFVRQNEVVRLRGDDSKVRRLLGPMRVRPLEETLRWMYENDEMETVIDAN